MKIVGNTKDYYDCMMSLDREREPLYVRKKHSYYIDNNRITPDLDNENRMVSKEIYSVAPKLVSLIREMPYIEHADHNIKMIIGFCGRLYPAYWEGRWSYSLEEVIANVEQWGPLRHKKKNALASLRQEKPPTYASNLNERTWNKFYTETLAPHQSDKFFRELNSPVFLITQRVWTCLRVNPILSDYGFQKIKNNFDAYQDISMYLSNNLANTMDPNPVVTDELKAHAHGFNEWSFRRHKTEDRKFKKKQDKTP